MENFKEILGYNGKYLINKNGVVISLLNNHNLKRKTPYVMKQNLDKYGYYTVCLSLNCYYKPVKVHRLVAETFLNNPDLKETVNHKNGIKIDNRVENLEFMTRIENFNHACKNGLIVSGANHKKSRLILNTQNGIFYYSIKEASESIGNNWKYDKLRNKINKNKSSFIYA
jgi:hypothetical protein